MILLGLPGAGKGTQAALLAAEVGVPHIATGDMFRRAMAEGSELGRQVRAVVESGGLVPDELTVRIVADRLAQPDCDGGFVLDGFPRTVGQAQALDGLLASGRRPLERAIHLNVPAEAAVRRLAGRRTCPQCGATYHVEADPPAPDGTCRRCGARVVQREDDGEEAQRRRLAAYRRDTEPLVEYYRAQRKLVRVDGDAPPPVVSERLRRAVDGGRADHE